MGREVRMVPEDWRHPVRKSAMQLAQEVAAAWPLRATRDAANVIDMVEQADGCYGPARLLTAGAWDPDADYMPLLGGSFAEEIAAWRKARDLFAEGKDDTGRPLPESARDYSFDDWHGGEPRERDYMPDWPAEARTHFQMYENTSEGTPISPVFASPEDLARWLANTGASAFADMTATYDQWLATIRRGSAVSAMFTPQTGLISGVEAQG